MRSTAALLILLMAYGCTHQSGQNMQPVPFVDIEKFMGDWYVIANIPTFAERGALDPVEKYSLNPDGTVKTTFVFKDRKSGKRKQLDATGFVQSGSGNAIWGMQFIWPIKADYRIVYLDDDYQTTIIGRNKRDYLWIMSRDASLPDSTLNKLIDVAVDLGYERSKIQVSSWVRELRDVS